MLYSILQIIAFQALFLLVYDLFLKRETFFNCNRAYLIITSVLALVLPFLKFPKLKTIATKDVVIHLPEVFIGTKSPTVYDIQIAEQAGIVLEQPSLPIWQIVAIMGIAIASLIFLIKITKLYWLKHRNPKRWQGNVLIVKLLKSSAAFSFFNTIFLGEKIPKTETPTIFQHELVHIKEYHTLDLLFFELLRIVFWFNPLVYIYQNRIKELHEFIADAKAVKQSGKAEYYTSLLNQVLDVNQVSFTNTFFKQSLIKKRIVMLQKSKSRQLNLIKYALLIPMVFGMLIYSSTEVRAQEKVGIKENVADQELTEKELLEKYSKEILEMEQNGATFFEISEYAGIGDKTSERYIPSKTEYLKFKAYMQYIADRMIKRKSEEGTLTQKDLDTSDLMRMSKFETYEDFKAFKNTKDEKERWESNTQDGILKLFVEDVANKTDEETKRFNALLKQLESDEFFNKLVVTDGKSTLTLDSYISNDGVEIIKDEIELVEVPFSVIDEVATLPECQDLPTNQERKECMNMVINKHIDESFDTSIGDSLKPGKKRIFVQFKIDTDGNVIDIKARGPSVELEQEAKRVVGTLPQFVPGKQSGETVIMPFSIPIAFEVKGDDDTLKQEDDKVPFSQVEEIPIHPECKRISNKSDQKQCTTSAINKQVGKNFNTDLANSLGLPAGKKRIFVQFTISKEGQVTNIKARGPHPKLEEEAIRVIKLLPQLIPGKHNGTVVDVAYSLPIVFETVGAKKE